MDDLRNQLLDNQTEMSKMRQEIRDLSRSKQQLLINTNNSLNQMREYLLQYQKGNKSNDK